MDLKYKLTKNFILSGVRLFQIEALKDFTINKYYHVKKGDLGGYIQKESNLSQNGLSCIADDSQVSGNAVVRDNGLVKGGSIVCGSATVSGGLVHNGRISGNGIVTDFASVFHATVTDNGFVGDGAVLNGDILVKDNGHVSNKARIKCNAVIGGDSIVRSNNQLFFASQIGWDYDENLTICSGKNGLVITYADLTGEKEYFLDKLKTKINTDSRWTEEIYNKCVALIAFAENHIQDHYGLPVNNWPPKMPENYV